MTSIRNASSFSHKYCKATKLSTLVPLSSRFAYSFPASIAALATASSMIDLALSKPNSRFIIS